MTRASLIAATSPAGEDALLPSVGHRVSLVLPDEIIAATLRSWDEIAEVHLDRAAPTPLPLRGLLQFMTPEGVLHHRGALSETATERGHLIRFKPSGAPQLLLARRRLRAEISLPVSIRRQDGTVVEAMTADLGESGLLLADRTTLRVGDEVGLTIHLGLFAEAIDLGATIVRVTEGGRAAAHYTEIDRESRERLGWRIFDHLLSHRRSLRA